MHAKIEFGYRFDSVVSELESDKYQRLRNAMPALGLPEEKPEKVSLDYGLREQIIDLSTTGMVLTELGISFELKRFHSTYKAADHATHNHLHVAIPNLLLFAVDEVQVLNDACTDSLQAELNDGWRILAVCPPPAQRRPDYILGRQRPAT